MNVIRKIKKEDTEEIIKMMEIFYSSPAVSTCGSREIFEIDVKNCIDSSNPYLDGFVLEREGKIAGYAMIAKSFSTEWGKPCVWIEDIYVKDDFRRKGLANEFLKLIDKQYPNAIKRLEVEDDNENAIKAYKKHGYNFLPYKEMKKD